jgi:succinate dehydrogenase flavin-adding protein (antitoxin of CptAB toxin-antitoxin module)
MTKLETIQKAIAELSSEELAKLRAFLDELEADLWDAQIARDAKAGKLDKLIAEAIAEDEAGHSTEL